MVTAAVALMPVLILGLVALVLGGDDAPSVLRVGVVNLPSLDPTEARDPTAVMVADQIFDTLVDYDPKSLEARPQLASWEVNPEQTQFTFHVLPGARFHDGKAVTAADVKYSLDRIARKDSPSPLVAQLEVVSGFNAFHKDGTAPELAGVTAPDPATVVIRLDSPFSSFPAVLGHPGFGIVSKAAVENPVVPFAEQPIGSGPFRVVGRETAVVHLVRDPGRKPEPKLEGIDLVSFPDAAAAYRAFGEDRLEVAPVPPGEAQAVAKRYGKRGTKPYVGLVFYAMNVKAPALTNTRVRQAVTLAIDRKKIVADVYGGTAEPADGVVAAGLAGGDLVTCAELCGYDPERARALLKEVFPFQPVPPLAIDHDDDPVQAAVAAAIKANLEAVGMTAIVRAHPFAEYGQFLVSGRQELFRLGWIADYPSPDGFLNPLFQSNSPENLTGLASPEVDAALRAARAEADPTRRQALYREVQERVLAQFVLVPVAQLQTRLVVADRVRTFTLDPLGTFDGATVSMR
jgi:peptide/nickel transport system substrate-binding protein/oligopeptide transport system substrate-binding protein